MDSNSKEEILNHFREIEDIIDLNIETNSYSTLTRQLKDRTAIHNELALKFIEILIKYPLLLDEVFTPELLINKTEFCRAARPLFNRTLGVLSGLYDLYIKAKDELQHKENYT